MNSWTQALAVLQTAQAFCPSLSPEAVRAFGLQLVEQLNGGAVVEQCHPYQPHGFSWVALSAHCRVAIHTWPERDGATLDVYVCNFTSDNTGKAEEVYSKLIKALKPADVIVERVQRGRDLPLKHKRVA